MHACMWVCVYVCMYLCMYASMYACQSVCMYVRTYEYILLLNTQGDLLYYRVVDCLMVRLIILQSEASDMTSSSGATAQDECSFHLMLVPSAKRVRQRPGDSRACLIFDARPELQAAISKSKKSMYACMYVCMHVCMYVYIYMYIYTYVCMHACMIES